MEVFDSSMHFKEGKFEVSLPWKEYHAPLSLKRLKKLYCGLCQNPAILGEYNAIIQDQIQKGIV